MGRHKYRKTENDIAQNGEGLFDVASAFAKNLTKRAAKSATVKLSEKAAESVGRKLGEKVFRKTQKPVSSTKITSGLSEARVENLHQSPENSGDEIFKILSSAAKAQPKAKPKAKPEVQPKAQPKAKPKAKPEVQPKAQPKAKPKAKPEVQPKQTSQKDSEEHKRNNQRLRGLAQQEINENLNRLMNMLSKKLF